MAAADVRDMLDLPADGGPPRPHKKQKVVEKRPGKWILSPTLQCAANVYP